MAIRAELPVWKPVFPTTNQHPLQHCLIIISNLPVYKSFYSAMNPFGKSVHGKEALRWQKHVDLKTSTTQNRLQRLVLNSSRLPIFFLFLFPLGRRLRLGLLQLYQIGRNLRHDEILLGSPHRDVERVFLAYLGDVCGELEV